MINKQKSQHIYYNQTKKKKIIRTNNECYSKYQYQYNKIDMNCTFSIDKRMWLSRIRLLKHN